MAKNIYISCWHVIEYTKSMKTLLNEKPQKHHEMSSKQILFTNPLVFNANPAWQLSLVSAQLTLTLAGAACPVRAIYL